MPTIAFVTYQGEPEINPDDRLVLPALLDDGIWVEAVRWDDPAIEWHRYAAIILRSTWDYHHRTAEFLYWLWQLERDRLPVWNPPALIRWNADKIYLRDLDAAGTTVIPALYPTRGSLTVDDLPTTVKNHYHGRALIKARIGASGESIWKYPNIDREKIAPLLRNPGVIIQKFMPEISTSGERSLIFFKGKLDIQYSHSVLKRPAPEGFMIHEVYKGWVDTLAPPPAPGIIEQARAIVSHLEGPWLYARVDGIEIDDVLYLVELEVIEPGLFLGADEKAPGYFTEAIRSVV